MNAELIAVGSEVLLGDVIDSNTAWLAQQLRDHGINLYHRSVVGDNGKRLEFLLNQAVNRSDLLIVTGGLGPTYDDITKVSLANVAQVPLVEDENTIKEYEAYFASRQVEATKNNLRQAQMPMGAQPLANPLGLAPGITLRVNDCEVILLPGPPAEMKATFEYSVAPWLFQRQEGLILTQQLHFYGIGEANLDAQLESLMINASNPSIAPYVSSGEVMLRIRTKADTEKAARSLSAPLIKQISQRFPNHFYGVDVGSLENAVGILLRQKNLTVSTGESCTGGLIVKRLTDIPGSSDYVLGGACTYSNKAKSKLLGVSKSTLNTYGAVSENIAIEMALGAQKVYGSDYALSTTGIAGPEGGTEEKPIGFSWIALATPSKVYAISFQASPLAAKNRTSARNAIAKRALFELWTALKQS